MKTGILARRPVAMGDKDIVVRFGLKSAMVAKYLATVPGSKSACKVKFSSYIVVSRTRPFPRGGAYRQNAMNFLSHSL